MCAAAAGWSQGHLDLEEALTEQRWEQQADNTLPVPAHPVMQRQPLHLGPPRQVFTSPGPNNMWMVWTMRSL